MEGSGDSGLNSGGGLLDLLRIDLIQDRILSYLNFQDLRFLSEVSRDTLDVVRKSKKYKKTTRLVIGTKAVENDLDFVNSIASTWTGKDLKIEFAIPSPVLRSEDLEKLFMKMESVKFILSEMFDACRYVGFGNPFLVNALEKAENIKHLELDPIILTQCLSLLVSNDTLASNLKNVETLKYNFNLFINANDSMAIPMGLKTLSPLLSGLKKFVFGNIGKGSQPIPYDQYISYFEEIQEIIKRNRETLEDLEIENSGIFDLDVFGADCIPKLKRLKISASEFQGKIVEQFLSQQTQLDIIHIQIIGYFSGSILEVIEEKHSKLKELEICIKEDWEGMGFGFLFPEDDEPITFWKFLKKFSELTCLMIRLHDPDYFYNLHIFAYGEDILDFVPSSVKTLVIEGFEEFWRPTTSLADKNIWGRLYHLQRLERLSLQNMSDNDALNDEGLQALIHNCPKLTALSFSHCSQLTSYGVSGVDSNGKRTGVSLDKLKDLRYLSIGQCRNIHWEDLLPVVKFDSLITFYFDETLYATRRSKQLETNKEIIARLLSQNPCLESLGLHLEQPDRNAYYNVKYMSRRLSHVNLSWEMQSLENTDGDAFPVRK